MQNQQSQNSALPSVGSRTLAPVQKSSTTKEKTVKQKFIDFLNSQNEKFPKNSTLNSLVQRFEAKYPDFVATLNLPKKEINLNDTSSLTDYDPSLDDLETASQSSVARLPTLADDKFIEKIRLKSPPPSKSDQISKLESRIEDLEESVQMIKDLLHLNNNINKRERESESIELDISNHTTLYLTLQ